MAMNAQKLKQNDRQIDVDDFRARMLDWYKANAREMPWRAKFGEFPDPYHEWLSEVMLQQTLVKAVIPYFLKFTKKWPTVHDLANALEDDVMKEWAGLGYYARARNLHKCAKVISKDYNGVFPKTQKQLEALPGIGPYTAAAISSIAFGHSAAVMDGNVERVLSRIHAYQTPIKENKKVLQGDIEYLTNGRNDYAGEFSQSLMELGATVCMPTSPKCTSCPIHKYCKAQELDHQEKIPVKIKKTMKPNRYGTIYFVENDQSELLFEKRPKKGLLGGMNGLPSTEWITHKNNHENKLCNFEVKHTFTHFHLTLKAQKLNETEFYSQNKHHFWHKYSEYANIGLPSLFQKCVKQYIKLKDG